jgi:hypothetical protein
VADRSTVGLGTAGASSPWEKPGEPGHTHDPAEVTVQLDGVGRGPDGRLVTAGTGAPDGDQSSDGPVFVDESGRRSRRFRRIGMAIGLACAAYAVVILVTLLTGNSAAPWVPVSIPGVADKSSDKVKESPSPSESTEPTATTGVVPGATDDPADPSVDATGSAGGTVSSDPSASSSKKASSSATPKASSSSTKKATSGTGGTSASSGGTDTSTGGTDTSTGGTDTSTGGTDTSTAGTTGTAGTTTNSADGPAAQTQVSPTAVTSTTSETVL